MIVLKHVVIKLPTLRSYPLFLQGILANLQERLWSGHHELLARVHFCDPLGLFLVMERARPLYEGSLIGLERELRKRYADGDIDIEFLVADLKNDNFGYVNGRLVKIDYGS